jgi:hypothetical protein
LTHALLTEGGTRVGSALSLCSYVERIDIVTSLKHTSHMSLSRGDDPRYPSPMTTPDPDPRANGDDVLRAAGIPITEEGKARFRQRLEEIRLRWTAERWAALREQLGLPEASA